MCPRQLLSWTIYSRKLLRTSDCTARFLLFVTFLANATRITQIFELESQHEQEKGALIVRLQEVEALLQSRVSQNNALLSAPSEDSVGISRDASYDTFLNPFEEDGPSTSTTTPPFVIQRTSTPVTGEVLEEQKRTLQQLEQLQSDVSF